MGRAGTLLVGLALLAAVGAVPARATPDVGLEIGQTSWSPDGSGIAYLPLDRGADLTIVAPDGSGERVFGETSAIGGRWSPDGRRIAWWSPTLGLRVADLATGFVAAPKASRYAFDFDWAPDGDRLLYRASLPAGFVLKISRWDGSDWREFPITAFEPAWSPRGDEVAWVGLDPQGGIRVMQTDGTGQRFVAKGWRPRWSPSGDRIAYSAFCGSSTCGRVVGRDGQGDREITRGELGADFAWSPSGRWVAIRSFYSLVLFEIDGGRRVRVSVRPDIGVSWSPKSDAVVFSRGEDVVLASTDGSERRVARGHGPDWSPAGTRISFLRAAYDGLQPFWHCHMQVIVLDLVSGREEPVSVCRIGGDSRRDLLPGTNGPDEMWGLGGPDVIFGGNGSDKLYGGDGHDRLYGGRGADVVVGGRGSDRVGVRDGVRDLVRCGRGSDVVFADRLDVPARDCERVEGN